MNVKEIITENLKSNGFDGLVGDECSCDIRDLMNCDNYSGNCEPGYKIVCNGCNDFSFCNSTVKNADCPMKLED